MIYAGSADVLPLPPAPGRISVPALMILVPDTDRALV
jgi:hypothetical protein